jgi:hypothetical protein
MRNREEDEEKEKGGGNLVMPCYTITFSSYVIFAQLRKFTFGLFA